MKRIKKHKIKEEVPTASTSAIKGSEDHDLAYFIHDRVELMHQVFSVLKSKELKAMAPQSVRRLSIDDLQELCLEELLGISSKRLCAILDGAEPPSDTESSSQSPERLETISLDSISSDEEILSQSSSKKNKKHKRHRHGKKKRKKSSETVEEEEPASRASRAGLTVLELLELQARARAIRAQLTMEPRSKEPVAEAGPASSDNEVEIKEEPAEVVEISSDDEKPNVAELQKSASTQNSEQTVNKTKSTEDNSQSVTKRVNDLVITVPQSKMTRKIKLNRNKVTVSVANVESVARDVTSKENGAAPSNTEVKSKDKGKKKNKKSKKKDNRDKAGSDQDEITLQLSDSEKMDLLEDLDTKNLDYVSSSSDSDSSSNSDKTEKEKTTKVSNEVPTPDNVNKDDQPEIIVTKTNETEVKGYISNEKSSENIIEISNISDLPILEDTVSENIEVINKDVELTEITNANSGNLETVEKERIQEISKPEDAHDKIPTEDNNVNQETSAINKETPETENQEHVVSKSGTSQEANNETIKAQDEKLSDGEISDRASSEVEAFEVQSEVVYISDEEGKSRKKKKKKDKKSKKDKKKKSDFREDADQNFYKDNIEAINEISSDDVYEILEISDDSSCYEVEGVSVLSKEPTAEEIAAFSAKIDEIDIDRDEVVTDEQINEHERIQAEKSDTEASWKERYLGSKKVKRVLTTSNILNAIRKRNKELKIKLQESQKKEVQEVKKAEKEAEVVENTIEDGSIEQFNTLQGSTQFVDPVKEPEQPENNVGDKPDDAKEAEVTREMKKDAKQLLKMYKRLLKYNNMDKQKDPNKKKKKKQKKSKEKEKQ